jgi:2-polyprenyl-3-methyl-5-hydroxy-6-metoxy-1,4-benzoquinol methylase
LPKSFRALDFGCGPGPTISILLKELGGEVENYDPIFYKNDEALTKTFDVVTSTEVVEHFKSPEADWNMLVSLIKPQGLLAVMTQFISSDVDYKTWWYKNDPTHVVFYKEETLEYLANRFQLEIIFNDKKSVVIFRKNRGQL